MTRILSAASLVVAALAAASSFGIPMPAQARDLRDGGTLWVPGSSVQYPGDEGARVHTNVRTLIPYEGIGSLRPSSRTANANNAPPATGYFYETPASLGCVYHLVSSLVAGCNPNAVTQNPSGGSRAIAIVDAYDDPSAAVDLANFSAQFGLPAPAFKVVYASGGAPRTDPSGGWELEESLDIEWAHAMAPGAKIFLVEAASSNFSDLFRAVSVASGLVVQNGGGEVSMSWGGSEFSGETSYDGYFTTAGVVYIASAGDSPGTEYPSVSPNVVSAGGTSTGRNPNTGAFEQENAWQVTGGGSSSYEGRPSYQNAVTLVGAHRGVPDLSFDADPTTGVWVLDNNSWYIVGGTSVAAPALAGIINAAGKFNSSSAAELAQLYGGLGGGNFHDIAAGNCGPYAGYISAAGWDFCTGIGSPLGLTGK